MDVLIGFDEDTGISVDEFAGAWNTEMSHEGVAEIRTPGDTFNAEWMMYLGGAAAAVKIAEWAGVPSLKDIIKQLFPKRAQDADKFVIEQHVSTDKNYVRVHKSIENEDITE
jgi:hypothetical protein